MSGASSKDKGARFERKVAGLIGGKRSPLSGAVGGGDIWGHALGAWNVECKKRAKLPALVTSALAQAAKDIGTGDNRRPLLVMEEDYGTPIVACYLTDFIAALEQEGPNSAWKIRELCRSIKKLAGQVEELAK